MEAFAKQVTIQKNAEQEVVESQDAGNLEDVYRQIAFDQRVLDDETIDFLFFDYRSPYFSEAYLPLKPYMSRLIAIGRLTEQEIRRFRADLKLAVDDAMTLSHSKLEYKISKHIGNHIKWKVIGCARLGFLLRSLTENRKIISLLRGEEKKGRW